MTDLMLRLLDRAQQDPDLQAGALDLSVPQVAARYFQSPGQVLGMLRLVQGKEMERLATETGIDAGRLQAYENGSVLPTPRDVVELSKVLGADLRMLMQIFGLIAEEAASESMGIAAQFGGTLSDEEKLSLKSLIEGFAAGRRRDLTE